ncbi:MAG: hypothetical protein KDI90_07500 [Alphaproteobacteria bacterium]|nr:hypothetical protein [Alphaproteobacteria bacterium]MCB9975325.1 hypothetical protein [Rhodospirillales bacterium]
MNIVAAIRQLTRLRQTVDEENNPPEGRASRVPVPLATPVLVAFPALFASASAIEGID